MLTIAGAFQYQKEGAGSLLNPGDFFGYSLDVLFEKVISDVGVFTFNGEYKYFDADYDVAAFADPDNFGMFDGDSFSVVGLYLLEKLVLGARASADPHVAVGWGSFFGLSVHAFTTGLALAAVAEHSDLGRSVFLSIVAHKLAEGFSLTTVLLLGGLGRRRILWAVGAFALVTPAGLLLGQKILGTGSGVPIVTALATGTFLFVAVCDLLPESFHERRDTAAKLALLVAGILASQGFAQLWP